MIWHFYNNKTIDKSLSSIYDVNRTIKCNDQIYIHQRTLWCFQCMLMMFIFKQKILYLFINLYFLAVRQVQGALFPPLLLDFHYESFSLSVIGTSFIGVYATFFSFSRGFFIKETSNMFTKTNKKNESTPNISQKTKD